MRNTLIVAGVALILVFAAHSAESQDQAKPAAVADYLIGQMHVQTLPETTYLYGSAKTTLAELSKAVNTIMPALMEGLAGGKFIQKGPAVFVYQGVMGDQQAPFDLEVGFPVPDGAKGFDGFKTRKLKAFRCATILVTGSTAHFGEAYQKLFAGIGQAGHRPTGETREAYLYWEGPESPNNVTQIQAGIN